jgi:nicotinamidase-related amidase
MSVTLEQPTALLVVDIQSGTLSNAQAVSAEIMVKNARLLVDAFHAAARPVIFALSTGTPAVQTAANSGGRRFPDEFAILDPRLGRRDEDIVVKRSAWSAFAQTGLKQSLDTLGVTELVIVGLATTYGIESTVREAADSGIHAVVPIDAISGPIADHHEAALAERFPLLARPCTTADVLAALDGS